MYKTIYFFVLVLVRGVLHKEGDVTVLVVATRWPGSWSSPGEEAGESGPHSWNGQHVTR